MTRPKPRYHPGDRIGGRYQVHKALMGGMGEVYLCLDLEQNYPYALKTFQQRYQSTALCKAFEQEVVTWVTLEKHPNIVRCFYMDILDNQPFMVLEWIAGEEGKGADLRGWLRHGPLDLKTALEITIDVVRGLIHAQEKQPGLVHRDLKPENILVAQGGLAKITDFGLAQIVQSAGLEIEGEADGRQSMVGKGGIAGTPAYMAPEQWRGEPLDERTDIYAVGCILYEMLTGEWPFQADFKPGNSQKVQQLLSMMQSLHESAPPTALADLSETVGEVVGSCLAKDPNDRPTELAAFLVRLNTLYERQFDQPSPSPPQASAFNAHDYNNRALTLNYLKRYDQALADYGRAIELDPNDASIYSNRGITYADLKQYEAALADYVRAIEIDPNYALTYLNRGNTYRALCRYEAALTDFGRAIELDPRNTRFYSNRGSLYADQDRYEEALMDFSRAIKLNPDLVTVYFNRGTAYSDLQRYKDALADFNRAIALNPNFAPAFSSRGKVFADLQQYAEALADFSKAIELDPDEALYFYDRGTTYAHLQQYEKAQVDFSRAIELDPDFSLAYTNRGEVFYGLEQYEAALADYSRAIELDPNFAPAYSNRGKVYADLQQYEEALTDFSRAIELDPNFALAYSNRGIFYQDLQQYEEALFDFSRVVELDPHNAIGFYRHGVTYQALQRYEDALVDYSRAIELDPNYAPAYYNRGTVLGTLQRHEDALVDYSRAIELDPDYGEAYFNLGVLLVITDRRRESLPYFEQAARLGLSQATVAIAQVRQELGKAIPEPGVDPAQQAFVALQRAASPDEVRQLMTNFSFMTQADFITAVEQVIDTQQVPPEHRPHFEQRLAWLKQIAQEQKQ